MVRRLGLCLVVLGALAVTPAAFAGYPTPMAQQGGLGVVTPDGTTRFLALAAGGNTIIAKIATADGSLRKSKRRKPDRHQRSGWPQRASSVLCWRMDR